ncbi:MAG: hypothetical protein JWO58_747 [Chitinophagaceae bacterium]|nr:hypothetical protein [Chitinophagaceae bacterium]
MKTHLDKKRSLWHLYSPNTSSTMLFHSQDIRPIERFTLLILDPLITALCLYVPLLLLTLPFHLLGLVNSFAFTKCCSFLFLATYLNKDIAHGQSLGKRILGYAVVNESNGRAPRKAICFLRNLTILVYLLELIYCFFSPNQKISDHLTKTKIIKTKKDTQPIRSFYRDMKTITYDNETREVIGLTVLLFVLTLFLK